MDIINTVVKTKRTRDNVRLMIPVLIHWAKTGQNRHTYGDLIHLIGKTRFSGIGHSLYAIQEVLNKLSEETEKEIPTLNSLCKTPSQCYQQKDLSILKLTIINGTTKQKEYS